MDRKCLKCGSTKIVKVVPAAAAGIPEIKRDIEEGRAVMSCCCAGTGRTSLYRCRDCGFEWDYYYELGSVRREEEPGDPGTTQRKDSGTTQREDSGTAQREDPGKTQSKVKKRWWK